MIKGRQIRLSGRVAILLLTGCASVGTLEVVPSKLTITEKKPLSVAVVVSDASRAVSKAQWRASSCFNAGDVSGPFGEIFVKTVRDRFSRLFEQAVVIRDPGDARNVDVVFEATFTGLFYKAGCLVAPQAGFSAEGSLRALAPGKRELWRSGRTESRLEYNGMANTLNLGPDLSQRISGLVEEWIRELEILSVAKYAPDAIPVVAAQPGVPVPDSPRAAFPTLPISVTFTKGKTRPDDIAVIIGNANYKKQGKDIPDVVPAYADAESFKRYAMQALGIREGNIIFLRDATGAQIVRVFGNKENHKGQLYDWVKPKLSRVVVYYAGHGAPGDREGGAYLVPSDADAARIELNGYPLSTLYANLSKLPAESVTVVIEACFSGASQGGSVISNASPVFLKAKAPAVPANITVIAAGGANQMASWEEDKSHGLFTKYFLKGMSGEADKKPYGDGDGRVGYGELSEYLKDTLTYYARRYYGRDQTALIVVGKGG